MPSPSPLHGTTVLDFSTVGPAARCSRILADYGARLVKIGAPPSRPGVQIEPPWYSYSAGRGSERVRLDLKAPEGRDAFLALAERADVIIESFRPGVVKRLGIGYDDVRRRNPGIVYCSTTGYGQHGPYAQWAGHDLNYLALGGYLACSGPRGDGAPPLPGATIADSAAGGMHAAIAVLAALLRRGATGEGSYLDVSVADGVLQLMSLYVDQHLATGERPGPGHDVLTGRYACYDTYAARDGRFLAVAAIEPRFFANLCNALDLPRWIPHQQDDARQEEMRADFQAAFGKRDRDDWVSALAAADTCVSPVYAIDELVDEAHFRARGAFCDSSHPERGAFSQVAPVLAGMPRSAAAVPASGTSDTEALLREAGLSQESIDGMRSDGVIA